ncbi:hypothetical protein L9F63_023924, partial [Diploptera punctata]
VCRNNRTQADDAARNLATVQGNRIGRISKKNVASVVTNKSEKQNHPDDKTCTYNSSGSKIIQNIGRKTQKNVSSVFTNKQKNFHPEDKTW